MVSKISGPHFPQITIKSNGSQRTDDKFIPEDRKEVARAMEQQFAEYMIQQMNNTVDKADNENQDSASTYYEGMMTSERAKMMANSGKGLGIQKIVLDQIYPQRFRTEMNYNNYNKMQEQNALHKKMIQTHKPSESNSIAMKEKEAPQMASDIAKGELQ